MKVCFVIVLQILLSFTVIGQNLVKNPGFEEYSDNLKSCCPTLSKAKYWNFDDFNSIGYISTAIGMAGYYLYGNPKLQWKHGPKLELPQPRSGIGMAFISPEFYKGRVGYKAGAKMQGQLKETLVPEQLYCVRFYFYYSPVSWEPVEELAVYFYGKDGLPTTTYDGGLDIKAIPQLSLSDSTLGIAGKWHCFAQTYQATGGETNFLIGSFKPRVYNSKYEIPDTYIFRRKIKEGKHEGKIFTRYNFSFYSIDDVAVFPISENIECPCE